MYKHASSFEHYGFIDWRQSNIRYQVGDVIYIYCTNPVKSIRYQCNVEQIDLNNHQIRNDEEYWNNKAEYKKSLEGKFMKLRLMKQIHSEALNYEKLLKNGLKGAPQKPKKLSNTSSFKLLNYIESHFSNDHNVYLYPEEVPKDTTVYEGLKKQVTINKYERSSLARRLCIEYHGLNCKVCEMSFSETYGEIGQDFIHVHHIIPIHEIGENYKIDYKKDLIPVCPNCHAMLHRKKDNKLLSIDELKQRLK